MSPTFFLPSFLVVTFCSHIFLCCLGNFIIFCKFSCLLIVSLSSLCVVSISTLFQTIIQEMSTHYVCSFVVFTHKVVVGFCTLLPFAVSRSFFFLSLSVFPTVGGGGLRGVYLSNILFLSSYLLGKLYLCIDTDHCYE